MRIFELIYGYSDHFFEAATLGKKAGFRKNLSLCRNESCEYEAK